jgi:F0F1-type ATP synthase membrane subunit b/b'
MKEKSDDLISVISEQEAIVSHQEAFYLSAEFWVGVSFILVLWVIYKPVMKAVTALIKQRVLRIKNDFQEAENLKLDAQKLYAENERKLLNIEQEVENIIQEESLIIEENKNKKIKDLNAMLRQKQMEVDGKIEIALNNTKKEINSLIVIKTFDILSKILKSKLTKTNYNTFIDSSILNISNINIKNDKER